MPGASSAQRTLSPAPHLGWTPGPDRPRLTGDEVHVWRADLTAVACELAELLCDEERLRAERLLSDARRELWMRSRGLLRALLGRYLHSDPRSLRFATGAHGKPALSGSASLGFNLSHSGQVALFALSAACAVGVDIEVARRPIDELAMAARTFGGEEARRLKELDPVLRRREFLRAWTRHEAALKCRGVGIGAGDGGAGDRGAGELWIAELDVGPDSAAAVALERSPRQTRLFEWH